MTTSSTLVFMVTRGLLFSVQDQAAEAPGLFLNIGPDVRTRQGFRPGVGGQIPARVERGPPPVFMSKGLLEYGQQHLIFASSVAAPV